MWKDQVLALSCAFKVKQRGSNVKRTFKVEGEIPERKDSKALEKVVILWMSISGWLREEARAPQTKASSESRTLSPAPRTTAKNGIGHSLPLTYTHHHWFRYRCKSNAILSARTRWVRILASPVSNFNLSLPGIVPSTFPWCTGSHPGPGRPRCPNDDAKLHSTWRSGSFPFVYPSRAKPSSL